MQAFLIRLMEINSDDAYQLYLYARIRCSDFKVIPEPKGTTLFIGVLKEPGSWKKICEI